MHCTVKLSRKRDLFKLNEQGVLSEWSMYWISILDISTARSLVSNQHRLEAYHSLVLFRRYSVNIAYAISREIRLERLHGILPVHLQTSRFQRCSPLYSTLPLQSSISLHSTPSVGEWRGIAAVDLVTNWFEWTLAFSWSESLFCESLSHFPKKTWV